MDGYHFRSERLLPEGLVEMFDSSIGAASVLMPYGGKYQLTENPGYGGKGSCIKGETNTVTMMSYGFDPYLSSWSPYHGAVYAVTESVAGSWQQAEILEKYVSLSRNISGA